MYEHTHTQAVYTYTYTTESCVSVREGDIGWRAAVYTYIYALLLAGENRLK